MGWAIRRAKRAGMSRAWCLAGIRPEVRGENYDVRHDETLPDLQTAAHEAETY
jgi:hypothetical protein